MNIPQLGQSIFFPNTPSNCVQQYRTGCNRVLLSQLRLREAQSGRGPSPKVISLRPGAANRANFHR